MSEPSRIKLSDAALAFDSVAGEFDERFGGWRSVAAQRRAVRSSLSSIFAPSSHLLEIGGGTGSDALWLIERGHHVFMTDASPAMVHLATAKFAGKRGGTAEVASAEDLLPIAAKRERDGLAPFDGAFSNFAALNCVLDLKLFARGLARLVRVGAPVILVLFGTFCPGEMVVEWARGRPRNMFRRLGHRDVAARLSNRPFSVRYHRQTDLERAMSPWFAPTGRRGIGVFVPPSAAEPWISRHPKFLDSLETFDRALSVPLAGFGDHILYRFKRVPDDA